MKLLHKSGLYYLVLLVPVLFVSGFIFYRNISSEIQENTDESLLNQKKVIEKELLKAESIEADAYTDAEEDVFIYLLSRKPGYENRFSDTVQYDANEHEKVPYRKLESYVKKGNQFVGITVIRSQLESEELIESISISLTWVFCLLLAGFLVINRLVSGRLWKSFYQTVNKLNGVSFAETSPPKFKPSSINEFEELNSSLNKMMTKMFRDFASQKQFTENASHELQTPLAVIKSKTDLLIQSHSVSEEDMLLIADIEKSVSKLTYLNRSLVLLSKIENRQFDESVPIDIALLLDKTVSNFEDRISIKKIRIERNYTERINLDLNPVLSDILFSNLIQNAVRYNSDTEGLLKIELTKMSVSIFNSGTELKGDTQRLFDRFAKFNTSTDSMGLGLSIVKQICEYYNFKISYSFNDGLHRFKIDFA